MAFTCSACAAFAGRTMRSGDVDLWVTRLDFPRGPLRRLAATLSTDEAERSELLHFAHDRDRFIAARGFLRSIISAYLNCGPEEIRFTYQPNGKPQLGIAASDMRDLRFNLSHSADAALYAISRGKDVGVDIELVRPDKSWSDVAGAFFAPGEIAKLEQLPCHLRSAGFFACWTRKEAYLKACGEGLSQPLDGFEVSLAPDEVPALLSARDPRELQRWTFFDIPAGEGFAGALVVEGLPNRLRLFTGNWPDRPPSVMSRLR